MLLRQRNTQVIVRTAFTLMEMLVVVAIIVTLAGVGGYYLLRSDKESKANAAKAQAKVLEKACMDFRLSIKRFPNDLSELLNPPKGEPFLDDEEALLDPWGQPYAYSKIRDRIERVVITTRNPDTGEEISNIGQGKR